MASLLRTEFSKAVQTKRVQLRGTYFYSNVEKLGITKIVHNYKKVTVDVSHLTVSH